MRAAGPIQLSNGLQGGNPRLGPPSLGYRPANISGGGEIITRTAIITPIQQAGLSLIPLSLEGSSYPGETVVYTFTVTNEGSHTDAFSLEASGVWMSALSANTTGPLAVGESFEFTLEVAVPAAAIQGSSDTATVTAESAFDPAVSESVEAVTTAVYRLTHLPLVLKSDK